MKKALILTIIVIGLMSFAAWYYEYPVLAELGCPDSYGGFVGFVYSWLALALLVFTVVTVIGCIWGIFLFFFDEI